MIHINNSDMCQDGTLQYVWMGGWWELTRNNEAPWGNNGGDPSPQLESNDR